jgi:PilZ domain
MAQEINDGTAYLKALRQSTGQPAATAAAPAREADTHLHAAVSPIDSVARENFEGAEKRRAPRHKCEGSAELREEGCDVRTWATFTDVSVHGCYVKAQATYPAGKVLHMKVEANGIRVETKGNVRVSYPYLGMGIAFS